MSNESKTAVWPSIFHLIGLAATALSTFMGLSYMFNGDMTFSIIFSVTFIIVLMVLVHYLSFWKTKKQSSNNDLPNRTPEIILGLIYGLAFLFLSIIGFHFMHINFSKKNEIKESGLAKIRNLNNLELQYSTAIDNKVNSLSTNAGSAKDLYVQAVSKDKPAMIAELNSILDPYKPDFSLKGKAFDDDFQNNLDGKINSIRKKYEDPVDSMQKASKKYISEAESVFKDWKFLKLGFYYSDAQKFYDKYFTAMISAMQDFSFVPGQGAEINFKDPFDSIKTSKLSRTVLFFAILLLLHICILAPYWTARRAAVFLSANKSEYTDKGNLIDYINQRK